MLWITDGPICRLIRQIWTHINYFKQRENIMHARIKKARQHEGGFTLVELLIVIVILGILAAVVVFSVGGITKRGKAEACEATKSAVMTAQEARFAQDGAYASTLTTLQSEKYFTVGTDVVVAGTTITSGTGGSNWTLTGSGMSATAPGTYTCAVGVSTTTT